MLDAKGGASHSMQPSDSSPSSPIFVHQGTLIAVDRRIRVMLNHAIVTVL